MNTLANNTGVVEVFTVLDDLNALLKLNKQISGRKPSLDLSEAVTISWLKSEYNIKTWKGLYKLLGDKFKSEFNLPSYKNFVLLMNHYAKPILILLNLLLKINRKRSGVIKLVDSTPLPVCKNYNIARHKTMKAVATRSRSTKGWFYGLKLHLVSDLKGNILLIKFTTARVGDRQVLDQILEKLERSIIVADAGYCSKKLEQKARKYTHLLITPVRKNMKRLSSSLDICLLNLRSRVEVIFSILKERLNLETSLPRSISGYMAHYIHVIFGYVVKKAIS
jgi:IS5 family transposase